MFRTNTDIGVYCARTPTIVKRDRDGQDADDDREECRDQRAKCEHQHCQGDRHQLPLVPVRVLGAHGADVDVERRSSGDQHAVGVAVRKVPQDLLERVAQRLDDVADRVMRGRE